AYRPACGDRRRLELRSAAPVSPNRIHRRVVCRTTEADLHGVLSPDSRSLDRRAPDVALFRAIDSGAGRHAAMDRAGDVRSHHANDALGLIAHSPTPG